MGEDYWDPSPGMKPTKGELVKGGLAKGAGAGANAITQLVKLLGDTKAMKQVETTAKQLGGLFTKLTDQTLMGTIDRILNVAMGPFLPLLEIVFAKVEEKLLPKFTDMIDKMTSGEMDTTIDKVAGMIAQLIETNWSAIGSLIVKIGTFLTDNEDTIYDLITKMGKLLEYAVIAVDYIFGVIQDIINALPKMTTAEGVLVNLYCSAEYAEAYYASDPALQKFMQPPCTLGPSVPGVKPLPPSPYSP